MNQLTMWREYNDTGAISIPEFINAVKEAGFDLAPDEARTMVEQYVG